MPNCSLCDKSFDASSSEIKQWTPRELASRAPAVSDAKATALYALAVSVVRFDNPPGGADKPVEWICTSCMDRRFPNTAESDAGGTGKGKARWRKLKIATLACLTVGGALFWATRPSAAEREASHREAFQALLEELPEPAGPVEHVKVTKLQWEAVYPTDLRAARLPRLVDVGDQPAEFPVGSVVTLHIETDDEPSSAYVLEDDGALSTRRWIRDPVSRRRYVQHLFLKEPGARSWDLLISSERLRTGNSGVADARGVFAPAYSTQGAKAFVLRRVTVKVRHLEPEQ